MNLSSLIFPDAVICNIEVNSKKRVLEVMAELLSLNIVEEKQKKNANHIFHLLIEREKLGSTGMGQGVALPHARTDLTPQAIGAFIKLKQAIDFDSPDKKPTDLIFGLMVPERCTEQHLQILAHLASLFSDTGLCNALRNANTADECYSILTRNSLSNLQAS